MEQTEIIKMYNQGKLTHVEYCKMMLDYDRNELIRNQNKLLNTMFEMATKDED